MTPKAFRFVSLVFLVLGATIAAGGRAIRAQGNVSRPPMFDHSAWNALLEAHVVDGMVNYDAFAASHEFIAYLNALARTDPSNLPRHDQLSFWLNAYNAYTIRLINVHGERESIRNIDKSFGFLKAYGPWKEKIAVVGGHAYGLDEIEQDIIRPRFNEPRVHFALVCAAMGCPPLRSEAYVGERLDAQLDDQARIFLASPAKNRVDVSTRTVYLSPIFVGFRDYIKDFGGTERAVGRFIARYYADGPERRLLESGDFEVKQTNYDWTLNSQQNARRRP